LLIKQIKVTTKEFKQRKNAGIEPDIVIKRPDIN
jgi:hypothetical protein